MGLLTGVFTLPLAPIRLTVSIAEQLRQQALTEYYDPGRIRQQLDQIDRLRSAGVLTDEQADDLEEELIERLLEGRSEGFG